MEKSLSQTQCRKRLEKFQTHRATEGNLIEIEERKKQMCFVPDSISKLTSSKRMGLCDSAEPRTLPWQSSQSEGILQSGTETEIGKRT